jgi:bla regulator protein blaR1
MFQSLLADRFKLVLHRELKEVSAFALVVAKSGSKLKLADPNKCSQATACGFRASRSEIIGTKVTMDDLARRLSRSLGRMVIDKTDLKGNFDLTQQWTPEQNVPLGPGATASPEIFAAIQDQLGLRLESTRAPVETLVIDHAERPSEN